MTCDFAYLVAIREDIATTLADQAINVSTSSSLLRLRRQGLTEPQGSHAVERTFIFARIQ